MSIPKINNFCSKSGSTQAILQLFDDKTFKIVDGANTKNGFDLSDFAFPVDSMSCIEIDVVMDGGELTLFDNEILTIGSPSLDLTEGSLFVRGIMIKITYPVNDDNGDEINITDKSVELWIEDAETLTFKKLPLYNLFTLFTNPKSNDPKDLINRIKIVNPNALYKVKITGLIVYGKAQIT